MRRYARLFGLGVEPVPRAEATPAAIRRTLARTKPVGCIVSHSDSPMLLPAGIFHRVPVVHLEPKAESTRAGICSVVLDNGAIGEMAFRELDVGRPAAIALARYAEPLEYSDTRAGRFLALAGKKRLDVIQVALPYFHAANAAEPELSSWATSLPRGAAIFAISDPIAFRVAKALEAAHRAIPREVRILGVDNTAGRDPLSDRLSSVELDFEHEGWLAARMLCDLASGRIHAPATATFGPRMVIRRDSTRAFRRRTPFVSEAVGIIRREACDGLTAEALAARFPCARALFDLRFREAMGHSAYEEILHVRLAQVDTLLTRTDTRIGAIAAMCGFETDHALRCLFRKRTGKSMREWRELHSTGN